MSEKTKRVRIRLVWEVDFDVPEDWTDEQIEIFYGCTGRHCATSVWEMMHQGEMCMCDKLKMARIVRKYEKPIKDPSHCKKCGNDLISNGEVRTPPIYAQVAGDTEDDKWLRDRYVCVNCGDVFDVLRESGEIIEVRRPWL